MNIGKFKLIVFDEIDSTSSEAMRIVQNAKVDSNYAVLAKSQTKGRGRSGKNWQSRSGNLHVSLIIQPDKELELLPQLSFVMALAVYESIELLTMSVKPRDDIVQLKWPNDVLVNGRKIAGILLESVKVENNYYLIIGIGINITYHPDNIDQPTTSLINENLLPIVNSVGFAYKEQGAKPITNRRATSDDVGESKSIDYIEPQALLKILIENFEKYYQIWDNNGFSFIREKWLKHAYKLHENISVKHQNELITGIFKDIDNTGRIILQLPSKKIISFSTVELSF